MVFSSKNKPLEEVSRISKIMTIIIRGGANSKIYGIRILCFFLIKNILCLFCFIALVARVTRQDTGLGNVDFSVLDSGFIAGASSSKRSKYTKWSDEERYIIGKYASVNGPAATVKKFKTRFPKLNESTARTFRKRVEDDLKKATSNKTAPSKSLSRYTTKTGRPLILGSLDSMVQKYILAASNRGAVISRASATSAATALLAKYPNVVGNIDIDNSAWAKSLFIRMGYTQRKSTSAKVEIPEKARREIEYQFHYDIVSKVERFKIPESLIINLDQTPSKIIPGRKFTMAAKGSSNVTIAGCNDKRTITATFAVTLSGEFLPMQLIYGWKTQQSLPRYKFPGVIEVLQRYNYSLHRVQAFVP